MVADCVGAVVSAFGFQSVFGFGFGFSCGCGCGPGSGSGSGPPAVC